MEHVEEACVPLISLNSIFLYLVLAYHILCRQIEGFKLQLCFFSCPLLLHPLSLFMFIWSWQHWAEWNFWMLILPKYLCYSITTPFFTLSSSLSVLWQRDLSPYWWGSPPHWGKYWGIALPLFPTCEIQRTAASRLIKTFESINCFLIFTEELYGCTTYISVSFSILILIYIESSQASWSPKRGRKNHVSKEQRFI